MQLQAEFSVTLSSSSLCGSAQLHIPTGVLILRRFGFTPHACKMAVAAPGLTPSHLVYSAQKK